MYGVNRPSDSNNADSFVYKQWFHSVWSYIVSRTKIKNTTISYTIEANVYYVRADASSGAITITLPPALNIAGRQIFIKKIDSGVNAVTVATSGSDTIEGSASISLATQWAKQGLISNGNNGWEKI